MKKTTKKVFNFITLGGATIAGMVSLGMPEITLIEWIGIYTGSRLLGEKLKFNEIKSQNYNELRETFKSSAFLAAGSLGAHVLAQSLPMTHLLDYGAAIGVTTGAVGMVITKVQEHKNKQLKI